MNNTKIRPILDGNGNVTYPLTCTEAVVDETGSLSSKLEAIQDQLDNYQPIEITGNVTNAADEEDLTSVNNLLKFKNRNSLNGYGYYILRRGSTIGSQMTLSNTIYEVRYNFDISQENPIEIPSGCILYFNGGSFIGGTLVGNQTYVNRLGDYSIFNGTSREGTWKAIQDINQLAAQVAENTSDISTLTTQVSTNTNNISTNTDDIRTLSGYVSTNTDDISILSTNYTNLNTAVGTNTNNISTLTTSVGTNTSDISTLNTKVSGLADEEDITMTSGNKLKFKDRDTTYGMGKIILRRNQSFKTQIESVTGGNTIFVIRYDFTLTDNVIIPANCVLEFDGGNISGDGTGKDTITGNNTIIKGSQDCMSNVILAGTFKNDVALISWFSNNTDLALTNAILLGIRIYVDKDIALTKDITISKSNVTIESKHNTITNGIYSIGISNVSNVIIKGINFLGTVDDTPTTANILSFGQTNNCHVEDCIVDGSFFYGIIFVLSSNCSIDDCIFKQSYNQAAQMLCSGRCCNYLYIRNNNFTNIGYVPPIQLNNCSFSYVEDNVCINVDNNPIFISSGCAHCTVKGNYISSSKDSGIILANDYILVPDGQGGETTSTDLPYDISIIGNYIYDCSDAGIALYPSYSTGTIIRNITIANNILKNNGVRQSSSQKFKSNILIDQTTGVSVVGNNIVVSDNTYGIFLCKNLSNSYDTTIDGYNHIIMGNSINANSIGTDVGSTNSQVVALKTDIGFPVIQNFNIYKHDDGGSYPDSKTGVFTWGQNPGDYAVACDFTQIDQNILGIHNAASPAADVSLNLTFDDLSLFAYNCIFTIKGLIKTSDASSIGRVTIRQNGSVTSNRIRINSPIIRSTSWVPFEISGLYNAGNVQKLEVLFTGTNINQWTYFKDVEFEIRYL